MVADEEEEGRKDSVDEMVLNGARLAMQKTKGHETQHKE